VAVMTVTGTIQKEQLGITLPHEHFFVDSRWACLSSEEVAQVALSDSRVDITNIGVLRRNPYLVRDNSLLSDPDLAVAEVLEFKKAGGKTVVDLSPIGTGRSPVALRNISNLTGLNILMGCGYYLKHHLPRSVLEEKEPTLTKALINEIRFGVGYTGIRPGVIGEIGIGPAIEEWERKSLKIAAEAHKETGLPIFVHVQAVPLVPGFTGRQCGIEVIDVLESLGVDPQRVVICHTDARIDLGYIKDVLKRGVYAEFDHFGEEFYVESADFLMSRDYDRILAIKELISDGYADRLLMSQDTCFKTDLVAFGGWGYAHILNNIVPIMLRWGIRKESVHTMMVDNPERVLDVGEKYL
jgi:phosphotriesterase-related protein